MKNNHNIKTGRGDRQPRNESFNKGVIFSAIALFLFFFISFSSALNDDAETNIDFTYKEVINYSTIPTVNSSDYWDGLDTPADISYDDLSGGDVNDLGYYGYFNGLGGVVGGLAMDGDPWWLGGVDFQIDQDLYVEGDSFLSDVFPQDSLTYSLGSGALRWLNLFVQNINAEEIETYNIDVLENITVAGYINDVNISEIATNSLHLNQDNWYNDSNNWLNWDGNSIEFNESKLETTYYNVSTAQAIRGTVSGTLNDINIYDSISYNVTEVSGAVGIDLRLNFTGVDKFNQIVIRYKNDASENHLMQLQLWNYDDGLWENYGTESLVEEYSIFNFAVFDYEEHISSGKVQLRVYSPDNGNTQHKHQFDWVTLTNGYATPSGIETDPFSWKRNNPSEAGNFTTSGNVTADNFNGNWNGSTGYVPYTGATGNVDLGANNFTTTGTLGASSATLITGNVNDAVLQMQNSESTYDDWRIKLGQNGYYGGYFALGRGDFDMASEIDFGLTSDGNVILPIVLGGYTAYIPYGNDTNGMRINNGGGVNMRLGLSSVDGAGAYIQAHDNFNSPTSVYKLLLNPLGGNVGIGTTNPSYPLHVKLDSGAIDLTTKFENTNAGKGSFMTLESDSGYNSLRLVDSDGNSWAFGQFGSSSEFKIQDTTNSKQPVVIKSGADSNSFYITATSRIGLKTYNPTKRFEINTGASTDGIRIAYNDADGGATTYSDFLLNSSGDLSITATGGDISFGDDNVEITGTLGAGATTVTSLDAGSGAITTTGKATVGEINLNGNLTTADGGKLYSNATCTFLASPDGSNTLEVCNS